MVRPPKKTCFVSSLTEVWEGVAGLVERPGVELQPDDGEDNDGEHYEEADLHQGSQRLDDRFQHNL